MLLLATYNKLIHQEYAFCHMRETWHHQAVELVHVNGEGGRLTSQETPETMYLFQQSVALQKGN